MLARPTARIRSFAHSLAAHLFGKSKSTSTFAVHTLARSRSGSLVAGLGGFDPAALLDAQAAAVLVLQITLDSLKLYFPSFLGLIFSSVFLRGFALLFEESPRRWCLHVDTMRECAILAAVNLILVVAVSCSAQVSYESGS